MVVAVGGGSPMDAAKLIALRAVCALPFEELDDAIDGGVHVPANVPPAALAASVDDDGDEDAVTEVVQQQQNPRRKRRRRGRGPRPHGSPPPGPKLPDSPTGPTE